MSVKEVENSLLTVIQNSQTAELLGALEELQSEIEGNPGESFADKAQQLFNVLGDMHHPETLAERIAIRQHIRGKYPTVEP